MKLNDVLSNRVPTIIRRDTDRIKSAAYMAFSFITFFRILLVPFFIIVVCFVWFCLIL